MKLFGLELVAAVSRKFELERQLSLDLARSSADSKDHQYSCQKDLSIESVFCSVAWLAASLSSPIS